METGSYTVKTKGFEGPFGLLLDLIEKRKLFINDLSLAEVTEDYLNYVNKLNPRQISNFLVIAATLILIKSKSLLPNLDLSAEEEGDIRNLTERLQLYELFTKLSQNIKKNFGRKIIFPAEERKRTMLVFLPDEQITRENMMVFATSVLERMPQKIILPEVEVKKVISIEEMIDRLTARIKTALKMNFREFAGKAQSKEEKVEVIVGFLAMLELVRQGVLEAVQAENYEDIFIEKL